MILCTLIGLAAAKLGGVASGTAFGLLAGFLIAPFVPLPAPSNTAPTSPEDRR